MEEFVAALLSQNGHRHSGNASCVRGSVLVRAATVLGLREVGDREPQDGGHSAQLSQL